MKDPVGVAVERLRAAGIESPRTDARLLWEHAHSNDVTFQEFIERRLRREPVAYILGHKEFWSRNFGVGRGVLVPRPETETLIEAALQEFADRDRLYRVLDLGTGSGCLLVALLTEYPNATGVGVDSSEVALHWAQRNVVKHGLQQRAELMQGGWEAAKGAFDLVVSNPPYIGTSELAGLSTEVGYEPRAALDGGPDGLECYRALAPVLAGYLKPEGLGLLELGAGQHDPVHEIMAAAGLKVARIVSDLAGIPRCLMVGLGRTLGWLPQIRVET